MQLYTGVENFADGELGIIERASSHLNDRKRAQWSRGELIAHANDEQLKIANIINEFNELYFARTQSADLATDQQLYELPSDMLKLLDMSLADSAADQQPERLTEIAFNQARFYETLTTINQKGDAGYFFVQGSSVRMLPAFSSNVTGGLRCFHIRRLPTLFAPTGVSLIPLEHHELLPLGVARRALVKFQRVNAPLEALYREGIQVLEESIAKLSPYKMGEVAPYLDWMAYDYGLGRY